MSRQLVAGFVLVILGMVGLGLQLLLDPGVATAANTTVSAVDYAFNPRNITVNVGDTVTWQNSTSFDVHTSTSNSGLWSSGDIARGRSFAFTFTTPGTYSYFCVYHSSLGMTGTVQVNGPAATPTTPPPPPPTSTPNPAGGRALKLSTGSVDLSWAAGTGQTGYSVYRLSTTLTTLPAGGPLPATATSFSDTSALTDPVYCYAVAPLSATGPLARSDLLCLLNNSASGSGSPTGFSIQLNQSTAASLSWNAGGGSDLILVALPLNGQPIRAIALGQSQTTATDNTGGAPTCYSVFALSAGTVSGHTPILCGLPGFSTFVG